MSKNGKSGIGAWNMNDIISLRRECASMGARTFRSLGNCLLHPQILRVLVQLKPADFEAQGSLLKNRLHPQIQIPYAYPDCISIWPQTKLDLENIPREYVNAGYPIDGVLSTYSSSEERDCNNVGTTCIHFIFSIKL